MSRRMTSMSLLVSRSTPQRRVLRNASKPTSAMASFTPVCQMTKAGCCGSTSERMRASIELASWPPTPRLIDGKALVGIAAAELGFESRWIAGIAPTGAGSGRARGAERDDLDLLRSSDFGGKAMQRRLEAHEFLRSLATRRRVTGQWRGNGDQRRDGDNPAVPDSRPRCRPFQMRKRPCGKSQ